MRQFLTLLLLNSLLFSTVPMALAEEGADETEGESETLVVGESCEDDSGFVFDVVGAGLVCVEIGASVPDTDCILTDDMGCEEIGNDGDDDDDDDDSGEVEDVVGDADDDDDDMVGDDDDDDSGEIEDVVTDVFENEGGTVTSSDGGITVVSEEVDESDLSDEMENDFEEATVSGDYPDGFYLLVQWGYFPTTGETSVSKDQTVWDGSVNFGNDDGESIVARPFKLVRFEKDEDSVDFEASSVSETVFESTISNSNDGILFKVKADLSNREATKVWLDTAYDDQEAAAYLQDLYDAGTTEFTYGDYKVIMTVFDHEDWLQSNSEHRGKGHEAKPDDAEQGAWYEHYMNYSVDNGFFQGYANDKGELTGKIGPGDNLTRFQLLKVMYELSDTLGMGVATSSCDPAIVSQTSTTDWMGEDWARGYIQCIEDSGVSLSLLDDVINEDLAKGQTSTLRWEVVVTAFEMLGIEVDAVPESDLIDLTDSGLSVIFQDMIAKADELDIVSGYSDGEFKPSKTVNRAEMFKIVSLFSEVFAL